MNAKIKVLAALLLVPLLAACGALSKSLAPLPNSWDGQSFSSTAMPRSAHPTAMPQPVQPSGAEDYPKARPTSTSGAWPTEGRGPGPTPKPTESGWNWPNVNPFVDTFVDHLSTFALDVDTASYARARDALLAGLLPDPNEVRVEEFVNYFDQDYPAPPDTAFAVYADGAPSPFYSSDLTTLLRIGVQGYQVSDEERQPLVLTFVIDVSGSMASEGKLEMVKDALAQLARRLRPSDSVAIVAYSTEAWTVLEPTSGYEHERIINAVYTLFPTNTTNVEAGLRLGYEWAWSAFREDASNRVILCSDGVANEGNTNADGILEYVHGYTERGITLTAIGVGLGEYNDSLLEQLADKGDGNYFYVDTFEEARRVLVDDLVSTLQVIALNAKIQVDFNPEVVSCYRLIGYENRAVADRDFRNDAVDAGEIGAGHSATAVYAVQFREGAAGRIATLRLRWEDPGSHAVREINGNVNTWDLSPSYESASPRYRLSVVAAWFAEILRGSPFANINQLGMLSGKAFQLTEFLPGDADVRELAELISIADKLAR
ncbi:MAG: von Willebrand factor type A domain-containing protein [Anaerolineales bacterium]|nr:von Willebrand factor type A domain-containing protein [Anaerolineales bacterium]